MVEMTGEKTENALCLWVVKCCKFACALCVSLGAGGLSCGGDVTQRYKGPSQSDGNK